jgi:hypothetical protein
MTTMTNNTENKFLAKFIFNVLNKAFEIGYNGEQFLRDRFHTIHHDDHKIEVLVGDHIDEDGTGDG